MYPHYLKSCAKKFLRNLQFSAQKSIQQQSLKPRIASLTPFARNDKNRIVGQSEEKTDPFYVGVFDLGYGELTILKEFKWVFPAHFFIYLGDNKCAPYGKVSNSPI